MKKNAGIWLFLIFLFPLLAPLFASAQLASSTNFILKSGGVDAGGGSGNSANFDVGGTAGQSGAGISSSTSFTVRGGFVLFLGVATTTVATSSPSSTPSSSPPSSGGGAATVSGGGGSGGYYSVPTSSISSSSASTTPNAQTGPAAGTGLAQAGVALSSMVQALQNFLSSIISGISGSPSSSTQPLSPVAIVVPQKAQPVFQNIWNLLPQASIGAFVFAPLPSDIVALENKFPQLQTALNELNVTKLLDVNKLFNVKLQLPGLAESAGAGKGALPSVNLPSEGFALPPGIPVADLTPEFIAQVPKEVVFARSAGEKIDLPASLSVDASGSVTTQIETVVGSAITLVVKPDGAASSVKGYVVLKNGISSSSGPAPAPAPAAVGLRGGIPLNNILASILFTWPEIARPFLPASFADAIPTATIPDNTIQNVQQDLELSAFTYTGPDANGLYTATIQAPKVGGEYEIMTLIAYQDPGRGTQEISMTAVVDPEGYVYQKAGNDEIRIPGAIISLYAQDPATHAYHLWPAHDYLQENPQTTDVAGTYAFLVPAGTYYITATAPGYKPYQGQPFNTSGGNEVHLNIELTPVYNVLQIFDSGITWFILVAILLLYHFYQDKKKEREKVGDSK
jgi:hypothetical protein